MSKVEVINTSALEPMFLCITGTLPHTAAHRSFNNKRYRTMLTEENTMGANKGRFWNWIQLSSPDAARELQLKYPDEIQRGAPSAIANIMSIHKGALAFGLGDVRPGAPFLFFDQRDPEEISAMVKWMRQNLSDPALIIRHKFCLRASFTDENDFVLARLKFQ